MTSLYRRATPRQARVLRIVEGAARNAAHSHPGWSFDLRLARSIAKRAAGTLVANWPSVLAVPRGPSAAPDPQVLRGPATVGANVVYADGRGRVETSVTTRPLVSLHRAIGKLAGEAKRAGDAARYEALRDALRLVRAAIEEVKR